MPSSAAGSAQLSLFEREAPAQGVTPRAEALARALAERLGAPVHLSVTDNRVRLVSARRGPGGVRVRVHHLFLEAPAHVVDALAQAARGDASGRAVLDAYARAHEARVRRVRTRPLPPRGRCFDLREVLARAERHLGVPVRVAIGWARARRRTLRAGLRLAVFDPRLQEVRVHPALDAPDVPRYVVEDAVFRALCAAVPAGVRPPPAAFPLHEAAQRWLRERAP